MTRACKDRSVCHGGGGMGMETELIFLASPHIDSDKAIFAA
jgi:hypothetical protein